MCSNGPKEAANIFLGQNVCLRKLWNILCPFLPILFFLINISTYSTMVYLNLIFRLVVIRIFTKHFITNLSTITEKKILLFLYIKLIFNRNDCIKQICAHYFIVDFVSELCTWEIRFTLYKYLIIPKKNVENIYSNNMFLLYTSKTK